MPLLSAKDSLEIFSGPPGLAAVKGKREFVAADKVVFKAQA